jgi:hypothetical protein
MLSLRKAKKRAITELSRYHDSTYSDESDEPAAKRSSRNRGRNRDSREREKEADEYYNSGRPTRAAALKVVSYAII